MAASAHGLLLCDDLIFVSRIVGTARVVGIHLGSVKTMQDLLKHAKQMTPRCMIMDLQTPGLEIENLVQGVSSIEPRPFLVGYGSHVDTGTLKRARDAGCDIVWPRSKFVDELSAALPLWFKLSSAQPESIESA